MNPSRTLRRPALAGTAALSAVLLVTSVATTARADDAGTAVVAVTPSRNIATGSSTLPLTAIANDGTIYASTYSQIDVWSPTTDGTPDVVKSFTGVNVNGVPSLSASAGLAFVNSGVVTVIDPAQPDGAAVPTRTIAGATTRIESPTAVAWTSDGSLWVLDTQVDGDTQYELLRFAPGATGDVAPNRVITGPNTGLDSSDSLGVSTMTGVPGNGVAVAPAGLSPEISVFTGSQSGDVKPSRHIVVLTPGPHWLSEGVGSDPQGRLYISYGDLNGDDFGRLDVFGPTADGVADPLLSLGGNRQRFNIPLVPAVAPNGTLALSDATIIDLGGSTTQYGRVKVFKPLFAKPGAPSSLKAKASGKNAVISWKAATSSSGTPITYKVAIAKGGKTVVSKSTTATSVTIARSSLPTGKLAVSVTSTTVGGSSAPKKVTLKN